MDVAWMVKIALPNDVTKLLLVCVEVLSCFIRVQTMKANSAQQVKDALATINLVSPNPSKRVWTDQGKDNEGTFKSFLQPWKFKKKYHTFSGVTKATLAERAIRSLKSLIVKYLEDKWMWRYIDKLQDLVQTLNDRVNRIIGMAPSEMKKTPCFSSDSKRKFQNSSYNSKL